MELIASPDFYILNQTHSNQSANQSIASNQPPTSLWFSRSDASVSIRPAITDLDQIPQGRCCGVVYGLVGKFQNDKLVVVRKAACVGELWSGDKVFKVQKIAVVSLAAADVFSEPLDSCDLHEIVPPHNAPAVQETPPATPTASIRHQLGTSLGVQKTWHQIKTATSHVKPRSVVGKLNCQADPREKYEKRIVDVSEILDLSD